MASIQDILKPITLTKVISRVAASNSLLLQYFGMQPGGPNEVYMGHGRDGSYHIFNHVRTIGAGTAPGTAARRRTRNPVGRVPFVYARMHEQISLMAEELHNLAKIDDPRLRDEAGESYIRLQTQPTGERAANWRTAMLVGMLRDSLYVIPDGDAWYFSYSNSGSLMRVNFQMPSGNKNQLNMLGVGSIIQVPWSDPSAPILGDLQKISAAFLQLCGGRLSRVLMKTSIWNYIINNDSVASTSGIADTPFKTYERQLGTGPDGTEVNAFMGTLKALPGVEFFISDDGLEIGNPGSEAFTTHFEDGGVSFCTNPISSGSMTMYKGSEPISEYDNGPETIKVGLSSWSKKSTNPTSTEIFTLDNAMCVNSVPASAAYGTVLF